MIIKMKYKLLYSFLLIILLHFIVNSLMPWLPGDDYVYRYVYNMNTMHDMLSKDAKLVSSFSDIFTSMKNHYLNWHGRIPPLFLNIFFLWIDKGWFNFINSVVSALLPLAICGCSTPEKSWKDIDWKSYLTVSFLIWIFPMYWSSMFIWVGGSVYYVWVSVFLLMFLRLYQRGWIGVFTKDNLKIKISMFLSGMLLGCWMENLSASVVLVLFVLLCYQFRKNKYWMYTGFLGILLGTVIMLTAPGLHNRLYSFFNEFSCFPYFAGMKEAWESGSWFWWLYDVKQKIHDMGIAIIYLIIRWSILYYFIGWSWYKYGKNYRSIIFLIMGWITVFAMAVSPEFLFRSSFFCFVFSLVSVMSVYENIKDKKSFLTEWPLRSIGKLCLVIFCVLYIGICYSFFNERILCEKVYLFLREHPKEIVTLILPKDYYQENRLVFLNSYRFGYFNAFIEHIWSRDAFSRYWNVNEFIVKEDENIEIPYLISK